MSDELSDFTKLVLARLETNPDEFQMHGRWDTLVRGLEAVAMDDVESRYIKTLWPLTDHERATILEAYRKAYLARLHKDMLKSIVSGDDIPQKEPRTYQYANSNDINPLKGSVMRGTANSLIGNQVLTPAAIQAQVKGILNDEFDKAYDPNRNVYTAIPKQEGTRAEFQRIKLTPTQLALAANLGISPAEYWAQLQKLAE